MSFATYPATPQAPSRAPEEDLVANPLERLNKEVKRRTDVVGDFPIPAVLLRLAGAVLVEAHDEWQVTAKRRYLPVRSDGPSHGNKSEEVAKPELMTA